MADIDTFLDDYLGSEHMLFLEAGIKEHADGILRAFFSAADKQGVPALDALRTATVESILLREMGALQLPLETRRGIPDLLEGFFAYLKDTGRFPAAGAWRECVAALADKYRGALRAEGGVRGETFKKVSTEVGRNDPCFCGSGLKFKKCCGN
jgi:uncharacterized protein YecA (UPF0149 family)